MRYGNPLIRSIARRIPILCACYFVAFAVGFLYVMQTDLLAQTQFTLSRGLTVYYPLLSTILSVSLLTALGALLSRLLRWLPLRLKALPWFLPFMLLGLLCHWRFPQFGDAGTAPRWYVVVLLLLVYVVVIHLSHFVADSSKENKSYSTYAWPNGLLMVLFTIVCISLSNTDAVLHRTLAASRQVHDGEYAEALASAQFERHPSRQLSAATALALSQTGQLGDRLFSYPQPWGSEGLLPQLADTAMVYNLPLSVGQHLGYKRGPRMSATFFLQVISEKPKATSAVRDYLLCAHLLDRRLDLFCQTLLVGDSLPSALPLHYREAIILHQHRTPGAFPQFEDDALRDAFDEFLQLQKTEGTKDEREFLVRERFGATYWCYFYFG